MGLSRSRRGGFRPQRAWTAPSASGDGGAGRVLDGAGSADHAEEAPDGEESQWILRCQAGDPSAFRALVEKYEERAFWVAYHLVGHVEDAQDVVQDAFIRAYNAIPRFRVGRRFFTWFYRILLHLAIDVLRKRRDHSTLSPEAAEGIAASGKEPPDLLARDEGVKRVQAVLGDLSPRERAILVLRDVEGLSGKEIAEVVRSNHATVRWWLFLARKQFRKAWELRFGEENPCA